jgi:hypothetical protein
MLTPQIVPRVNELFFSGFSFVAFFMAQIYASARLIPATHPYLSPANMGKYGIRHVVAEAANNLRLGTQYIDQILIFIFMLVAIALLFTQFILLGSTLMMGAAHAGLGPVPDSFASYFLVPAGRAEHDVAFVMLDRVFGVPGLFVDAANNGTCVAKGSECFNLGFNRRDYMGANQYYASIAIGANSEVIPGGGGNWAFPNGYHLALQTMFDAYSKGILIVATFILIYFVMAIIAETAQSGTAFGRRFNRAWAPLRLVAAIGLLVPLTNGLNSGQYILLHAAKWGSGFATNGWNLFYSTVAPGGFDSPMGDIRELVVEPSAPMVNTLLQFSTVLATCKLSYERMYYRLQGNPNLIGRRQVEIDAYLVSPDQAGPPRRLNATSMNQALDYFDHGDISVIFGEYRANERHKYQSYDGNVAPLCGKMTLNVSHYAHTPGNPGDGSPHPGADFILYAYYVMMQAIWEDILLEDASNGNNCAYALTDAAALGFLQNAAGGQLVTVDRTGIGLPVNFNPQVDAVVDRSPVGIAWSLAAVPPTFSCIGKNIVNRYLPIHNDPTAPMPSTIFMEFHRQAFQYFIEGMVDASVRFTIQSDVWLENMSRLGWGGAAVWYNKVAEMNGPPISQASNMPFVAKYPEIQERVQKERAAADADIPGEIRHQVSRSTDSPVNLLDDEHYAMGKAMYVAESLWHEGIADQRTGGNIFLDVINMVFGTEGLFDMTENHKLRVHPLAQLAGLGRSIMDSAIANLGYSAASGLGGGIINMFSDHMTGRALSMASGFLTQIATVGLTLGFVLFYVIPLLPFIYFFFAVGGWIKGIFEAMVGVPLWALAHLRIDGNGLPGDAAMGGYYLILEIFLRPILIVFGFLASITIFGAQAQVLSEIWSVVVSNSGGYAMEANLNYNYDETGGLRYFRGAIDKLFYTVIYAIVVYMLGMSAFKMIDLIPNHILRWMGASVSTFGDQSGDPAQNLVRNSFIGGNMLANPIGRAAGEARNIGNNLGNAVRDISQRQ